MKLQVLHEERFSCHSCGNCCRDWHVELMPGEAERVRELRWSEGDPLRGAAVLTSHRGRMVVAHRDDGSCVFLNPANGRCRIHEQFGASTKPLGCRLFPFHVVPTFPGEASIAARFDCPSVCGNEGESHAEQAAELRRLAGQLTLTAEFDELTRCMLDREQIQAVVDFAGTLLRGFERDDQRALFIHQLCEWLSETKVGELDRMALAGVFAALKERVEALTAGPVARPGRLHRVAFRTLLALYLRRDEDVLNGKASRLGRVAATARFVLGFGSPRSLGLAHAAGSLRSARLFKPAEHPHDPAAFALHWRMVRTKLGSFQFMGAGNQQRNFLEGLRSLALLYPLVLAVARHKAASRGAASVESHDVRAGVAAIEHSFGKLAILGHPLARFLETLLLSPSVFPKLARGV